MQKTHYAPLTPTYRFDLNDDRVVQNWLAKYPGKKTLLLRLRDMPIDPIDYARQLYATLRELDNKSADAIWIELPPDEPAWIAVRDRLIRASPEAPE